MPPFHWGVMCPRRCNIFIIQWRSKGIFSHFLVSALVSSSSSVAVSLTKSWGEMWDEALKALSWAEIVFVIPRKAQHVAGKRVRWQMGWVQLQSNQGDAVERLSCCGRQVGHNVDNVTLTGTSAVIKNGMIWIKGVSGKGTCRRGSIDLCAWRILPLEKEGSSQSPLDELACTAWKATEQKWSWRLQQKCPVQFPWWSPCLQSVLQSPDVHGRSDGWR